MRRLSQRLLAGVLLAMLAAFAPTGAAAQEAGATCATAGIITENGSFPFSTTSALANDPCGIAIRTVWFRFVAPENGLVVADLCGSNFDTFLAVYEGDNCPVTCANVVAANNNFCGLQSSVTFAVQEGMTYHFSVNGSGPADFGSGSLNFDFTPASENPGFSCLDPAIITGSGEYPFVTNGRLANEPCYYYEPAPTMWFRYDVPASGTIYATTCAGGAATFNSTLVAHVTNGECPAGCATTVGATDLCGYEFGEHGISFFAAAGSTVYLTVSGYLPSDIGSGTLTFIHTPTEAGDTCAEATELEGSGAYGFDTAGAGADDPCREGIPNVWYRFTAPFDGPIVASLCGTTFDSHLSVFAGEDCPGCGDLLIEDGSSCEGRGAVQFDALEGQTYYFSIGGATASDAGPGVLNFSYVPMVAANLCANAPLIVESGTYPFSNIGASNDDPCRPESPTVWYAFQAPSNGELLVETCGLADYDTFISVFEGACPVSCDNLIGSNDDGGGCGTLSSLLVPVSAGQTYRIALSGYVTVTGSGFVLIDFNPSGTPVILGDIDGDGVINVADVTLLGRLVAAGTLPINEVGDINGDNVVNVLDVEALAELIVGN